jgi:hypothetical protein
MDARVFRREDGASRLLPGHDAEGAARPSSPLVPAKAGTQSHRARSKELDSRLRGNERSKDQRRPQTAVVAATRLRMASQSRGPV